MVVARRVTSGKKTLVIPIYGHRIMECSITTLDLGMAMADGINNVFLVHQMGAGHHL